MARIRDMGANNESPLLPAMFAFGSEETSPYNFASDLAEGLLIAKEGLSKKRFLKQYCQGSIEAYFNNDPSCTISVLVGTQDAIHKWLRMSGHARCVLWIEHVLLEGDHENFDSSAKLELVYRQRDYRVFHVQVLQKCKLILSLARQSKSKQSKKMEISKDDREFDWNGLQQCKQKHMGNENGSNGADWWKGTTTLRWYILMKVPAFKKLKNMLSPGGALWEFRRSLLQITNLPEFLDIDFQNINLQERLNHHPYAIFLIGSDVIMARIISEGIFVWKIVKFDFDQGIVTLARGETLKTLMYCIKNYVYKKLPIQGIEDHQQITFNKELDHNSLENKNSRSCSLDWAVWRGIYRAGPIETILTSAFTNEDDWMIHKSLTTFFLAWKDMDLCKCCIACDVGTAFRECRSTLIQNSNWKLSSKERCAISHLRSIKQGVCWQGLRTLLNILLHEVKDFNLCSLQKTALNSARWSRRSTPISSRSNVDARNTTVYFQQLVDSKSEVYLRKKENVNLLSGLMAIMDRPSKEKKIEREQKFIGSETDRALQAAKMKWKCFEEMKSDRSSSNGDKPYITTKHTLVWQQVLEWVDNGFLEILLKEGMSPISEDGKVDFILEDLAYACLQVVKILPYEGSYRIVNCLVSRLKNIIDTFSTLKTGTPQQVGTIKEPLFQQKTEKLKITFEEILHFCKFLGLLLVSSVSIASSFASQDGLFLILNLYSIIVKEFPVDINNLDILEHEITTKALPGEVSRLKNYSPKVLKPHTSNNVKVPWCHRQEETKSKGRFPLQELSMSSQISSAFSLANSKVSNINVDDNVTLDCSFKKVQSNTQKSYFIPTSKTIKKNMPIESDTCSLQILATIIDVIWETKLYLLQSLVTMFESHSITLNKCKAKMKEELFVEATASEFLSWLFLDLIGGHSNVISPCVSQKLSKIIFKIIFLFERDLESNALHIQRRQENQLNFQYVEEGPWWSGPGPPLIQSSKIRLLGLMLVEMKERMDHILANLMATLPCHVLEDGQKFVNYKKMTKDNEVYIHFLWINLACLFMILLDYVTYWPTKELQSQHVLQCYGGHFHQTLSLLASLGPVVGWTPAQILTTHNLLKLLSLCIEDSITIDAKENWSEYEKFLWEMLIGTWAHWNCIQSYISWMALEVCQGCLNRRINDFQKNLLKSTYLFYPILEEKLGMKGIFEDFQHFEFMPMKAMMFLHLVVLLVQRKFYIHNSLQDGSVYLCFSNNALWFLQEIMNPVHGLLIMIIKTKPLQTCTDCKIETTNPGFVSKKSFSIEQYSLILLAQIFNFKFFSSNACVQGDYSKVYTNVYLSKKYLISFLHILYSSFKNLYTRVVLQTRPNSLYTLQDIHSCEDENKSLLTNRSSLENTTCNDKNTCSTKDEILNLCYLYAQVLHDVAKSLSKDGNQIFKNLSVMDFLIQEISLEYEFFQKSDAKSNIMYEMTTNSTTSNIYTLSSRKNLNMIKEQGSSNSSSRSNRACDMLPSLAQEYELKNSILFCHDYMSQRNVDKCDVIDENLSISVENCKLKTTEDNKGTHYLYDSKPIKKIIPKDVNYNDNDNIVKNASVCLSCNPIYGIVNFDSNINKNDFKSFWGSEYNNKEVVYSGRFFDLNEEVERELAAEEDDESNEEDQNVLTKEIELIGIERQDQSKSITNASISPTFISPTFTSPRNIKKDVTSTLNTRPWVPKLNFTSALQKSQSNMTSGFDSETTHNSPEGEFCNNEDVNNECKSPNLHESYEKGQLKRPIYYNSGLHILLLELIICLMLDPQGALEVYYCDRFPMEHRRINAPFYLFYHINHTNNEYVVPILAKRLDAFHPSAYRIIKLMWQALFDSSLYTNRIRIAQGALSQVYTATKKTIKDGVSNNELVVLKVVALPKGPHEPCSFFDVYSEVEILERFHGDPRVCQILDYGVDRDAFVLVLKHYKCSLRAWRQRHSQQRNIRASPFRDRLLLYLQVYADVLQAVKALEAQNVVHYDLKCDNVLLEPLTSTLSEEDFWEPKWPPSDRTCAIPFRVSITDFGQSKVSFVEGGECTARNRGTECVKSPEMLKLLSNNNGNRDARQASTSNLEDKIYVGKAGDVWGLGCLLYELLTGEYLLYDDDWVRFFMRVTLATEELIPDEKAAKLDNFAPIIDFLRFILVRDPNSRPSLDDLVVYLQQLQGKLTSYIPQQQQQQQQQQQPPQLHDEPTTPDIFDELGSDMENEEPQNQLPSNAAGPLRQRHAVVYQRCHTPSVITSKRRTGLPCVARRVKRHPRFWRWCCACCWRNADLMR